MTPKLARRLLLRQTLRERRSLFATIHHADYMKNADRTMVGRKVHNFAKHPI
jgi:hypothetical protein